MNTDDILGIGDTERFAEMTNKQIYYQLYDTYKLVKYLSQKHEINESQLNSALNVLRSLGTIYGSKAYDDTLEKE